MSELVLEFSGLRVFRFSDFRVVVFSCVLVFELAPKVLWFLDWFSGLLVFGVFDLHSRFPVLWCRAFGFVFGLRICGLALKVFGVFGFSGFLIFGSVLRFSGFLGFHGFLDSRLVLILAFGLIFRFSGFRVFS